MSPTATALTNEEYEILRTGGRSQSEIRERLEETLSQLVYCVDPECLDPATGVRSIAEPEQDGDHLFYECVTCGFAFGWEKKPQTVATEGSCAIGVPEDIRRAASAGMDAAMTAGLSPTEKPVTLGRKPGT